VVQTITALEANLSGLGLHTVNLRLENPEPSPSQIIPFPTTHYEITNLHSGERQAHSEFTIRHKNDAHIFSRRNSS